MVSTAKSLRIVLFLFASLVLLTGCASRPVVLLTGYWPPTNEMLRPFSDNPAQNPDGWVGRNWQNTGCDVYAYFPEFPGGTTANPKGDGDFEVDYQDVFADFQRLTEKHKPIAIISYGLGKGPWEIEVNFPYYDTWHPDYKQPRQPATGLAASDEKLYQATLPVEAIQKAVTDELPNLNAWIDQDGNPGDFLCGYIGYLGAAYQAKHDHCKASGFIHVGKEVDIEIAQKANEATLREVIEKIRE